MAQLKNKQLLFTRKVPHLGTNLVGPGTTMHDQDGIRMILSPDTLTLMPVYTFSASNMTLEVPRTQLAQFIDDLQYLLYLDNLEKDEQGTSD